MKWYNGVMGLLTILCVGIVLFVLTGCANTADMKTTRLDNEGRKHSANTNKPAPGYGGDMGMPKEWMEQWPSLREENNE